ncbi:helix-turn-helix domain-containing protein [Nocardia gipuzkoensis]
MAAALQVSPRTLQRKLELAGHDFAELRDETLCDLACDLLANSDHSISRISRTLGYKDAASFTIAFKRWEECRRPPTERPLTTHRATDPRSSPVRPARLRHQRPAPRSRLQYAPTPRLAFPPPGRTPASGPAIVLPARAGGSPTRTHRYGVRHADEGPNATRDRAQRPRGISRFCQQPWRPVTGFSSWRILRH